MEKFKGTPGPWEKHIRRSKKDGTRIVAVIPKYYGERRLETELVLGYLDPDDDCGVETCCCVEEHSNARLIANSPDLLKVLLALNKSIDDMWNRGIYDDAARMLVVDQQYKSLEVIDKILKP